MVLNITYNDMTCKINVENPTEPLSLLIDRIKNANIFDMPDLDPMGNPSIFYFVRPDEDGMGIFLRGKNENGQDLSLKDYDIKSGETLYIHQLIFN